MSYKPTAGMKEEAQRGLDWREEHGRGGTRVGAVRARQIVAGENLSEETVKRMYSFFSRHEVDKQAEGFSQGEDGYPSNGRIAWALWGGDAGYSWSRQIVERLKKEDERAVSGKALEMIKNKVKEHNEEVGDVASKRTTVGTLSKVYERGIGAYKTNPASVRPNVTSPEMWAASRVNSFLFALRNGRFRSGKHDTDLLPEGHPQSTKNKEKSMDKVDERHILNIDEKEDSVVIEFSKHHEDEIEESEPVEVTDAENGYKEDDEERKVVDLMRYRTLDLSRADYIDEENRRVRVGVSSEEPVNRSFGKEVLGHKRDEVDMEFMSSGTAPFLLDHDMTKQIGVIEEFKLDETAKRTIAVVRFGKSALAREVFEDVVDGIRMNISVGYKINKMERVKDDSDEDYYRASWTPLEVSSVAVPADQSKAVGVGRSETNIKSNIQVKTMENEKQEINLEEVKSKTVEEARAEFKRNSKEILDLAVRHNRRDLADKAISEGVSVEEFRGVLLENIANDKPLDTPAEVGLKEEEKREYSLLRAINAAASGDWRTAGFEREVSDEIASRTGKEARGFYIPADISWGQRDQTVGTNSQGGFLKPTEHLGDQFIEALQSKLTITSLGARVMAGLKGDISIPKMSASVTNSAFVAEGSAPSEGAATFAQVTMSPKTLAAYVDVSRKLMMQSDPSVEQLLRNDIIATFARKIDEVAIEGGASNEPSGILNDSDAATVAIGTNGGAITYAKVVDLVKEVEIDNAIIGDNPAFLTNPKVIAKLRTIAKQGSGVEGNFILDPNNTMLGYNVESTNLVPSDLSKGTGSNLSALIYGDFSQLMLGFYSGVDVVVDQASLSTSGGTRLAFFQDCDVAIRHGQAFSFIKDITT